ncbi:MAG: hypothetical protein ACLQDY_13920 [Streptosporangiaceae bacterium]
MIARALRPGRNPAAPASHLLGPFRVGALSAASGPAGRRLVSLRPCVPAAERDAPRRASRGGATAGISGGQPAGRTDRAVGTS